MKLENEYFLGLKNKKNIALRNVGFLKMMSKDKDLYFQKSALLNRAERITNCLTFWEWARYDLKKVLDLKKVSRCKDVYCPNCRRFNIGKYLVKNMPVFADLISQGYSAYMMTLTVPNVEADELKKTIEVMNKSFKLFYSVLSSNLNKYKLDKRLFDLVGAIKSIEVTYNYKAGTFHPHFHIIVFMENEQIEDFCKCEPGGYQIKTQKYIYYSEADLFIQQLWTKVFYSLNNNGIKNFDNDEFLRCDIQQIELPEGIFEVFKYVFKDSNIQNLFTFKTVFEALANKKLRQGYGLLYNVSEIEEPDKLVDDCEDEYITSDDEFEIENFRDILTVINKYPDYVKVSRFNKDNEYYKKIRD